MTRQVIETPSPGNQRKIDYYMSTARDFADAPGKPSFRYLLCSSPRCGSTLLGEMLYGTGVAGDPLEYLNGLYVASHLRQSAPSGKLSLQQYLGEIQKRRTSPNGYFGIQIHFAHFNRTIGRHPDQTLEFLRAQDRIILLRRRDKVAQAVSLYRATVTGIYSSLDQERQTEAEIASAKNREIPYDRNRIAEFLKGVIWQDAGWESLLLQRHIPYQELYYEDLTADYRNQSRRVLEHLNLAIAPEDIPEQKLRKLGTEQDPLLCRFREYLGLSTNWNHQTEGLC